LWTGGGGGKTTNALGLALRSIGHGQKVVIIQFLKGQKNIGEVKFQELLPGQYEIHQFGTADFVDPRHLRPLDYELAYKGVEFARKKIKEEPDLFVLDEVNIAAAGGLVKIKDILDLLKDIPEKTTVVMTGRFAPREFLERAEFVNEIIDLKHPKDIPSTKGIQY